MARQGKEKCEYLRNLRIKIAEANGIEYTPAECHHEGDCPGFCPVCDAEMEYIRGELKKKAEKRKQLKLKGLLVDVTRMPNYSEESDDIRMGGVSSFDVCNERSIFQIVKESAQEEDPLMGAVSYVRVPKKR